MLFKLIPVVDRIQQLAYLALQIDLSDLGLFVVVLQNVIFVLEVLNLALKLGFVPPMLILHKLPLLLFSLKQVLFLSVH